MRKWLNNRATDRYTRLRAMYKDGILDDDIHGTITEKGITDWGELVYTPDMTLEDYLGQFGIPDACLRHEIIRSSGDCCIRGPSPSTLPSVSWAG